MSKIQPENLNFLNPLSFIMIVDKLPTVTYMCQAATLPGLTLGEIPVYNPNVTFWEPGDKLIYEPVNLRFRVDENMKNYIEIMTWMIGLGKPISPEQYRLYTKENTLFSDITIQIATSHKNAHININLKDAFPTNLTPIEFDTTNSDVEFLESNLTLRYRNYDIELIK